MMEYKLIRSRRKTVTLRVLPGGVLEVRAPLRLPRREIDRIVGRHADWAQRAIAAAPPVPSPLREGALLPFLGKEYPIALREGEPAGIREGKFCLPLPRSAGEKEIKDAAEKFYRAAARELLPPKLERYAALFGTDWTGLRITSARTRWGSCSAKGSVNFSWRLMAAPEECIDYVAAHEFCHRLHFDHSPAFYSALSGVIPDWQNRKELLRKSRRLCW